jgi:hypothetical protein
MIERAEIAGGFLTIDSASEKGKRIVSQRRTLQAPVL